MTLRISRRPAARTDLLELWNYIANDSEAAADRLLDRIEHTLGILAENGLAGRARPEISTGLRSFPVGNYVIFYRVTLDVLVVTRVLSSYRDVDRIDFG